MRKRKKSDRQEGVSWTLNIDDVTYRNFDKMKRVFKVPFEWQDGVLSVEQKFSEAFASTFHTSARTNLHFDPDYTKSQQNQELAKANNLPHASLMV